jgi:hypothetical protein
MIDHVKTRISRCWPTSVKGGVAASQSAAAVCASVIARQFFLRTKDHISKNLGFLFWGANNQCS